MTDIVIAHSSMAIRLPWPPSVNGYWQPYGIPPSAKAKPWIKQRIRVVMTLTDRAKLFRDDVSRSLLLQFGPARLRPYRCPVRVDIELRPPDRRLRDIDNHLKGLFDALTYCGVWEDDSLVDELTLRRGQQISGGRAIVLITSIGPDLAEPLAPREYDDDDD